MPFSSNQVGWRVHVGTWLRFFMGMRLGPYHEMNPRIVRSLLKLGGLRSNDHVWDIGCGDGRVLLTAARMDPSVKCTGVEIDRRVAEVARMNVAQCTTDISSRIQVLHGDARKAGFDLSSASLITLYLSERGNAQLLPKLNHHLLTRPDARVVSFIFPMKTWKPAKMELEQESKIPMFLFDATSIPEEIREKYKRSKEAETSNTKANQ